MEEKLLEKSEIALLDKLEEPPMYQIVLFNDDITPMDFVVQLLVDTFNLNMTEAVKIMLEVHNNGKGYYGMYSLEIAETKVAEMHSTAQQAGYPFSSGIEKI